MRIAMIPARLSSRRIERKNLRRFCGGSLLEIAVSKAIESKMFDRIYVNSPDQEIRDIAVEMGALTYTRSVELDAPSVTNNDFLRDFFKQVNCIDLYMLNTTSPLVSIKTIKQFIEQVESQDCDTMMSVVVERAPILVRGEPCNFSYDRHTPSESLTPFKKIVWAITYWTSDVFLASKCGTYAGKIGWFEIPKSEAIDLDTEQDWIVAEAVYNRLYGQYHKWLGYFPELGGE